MATPQQKKHWQNVGLMMAIGLVVGMFGVIKSDDLSNLAVAALCTIGFGAFIAGFVMLVMGTKR